MSFFFSQWPILSNRKILTFRPLSPCIFLKELAETHDTYLSEEPVCFYGIWITHVMRYTGRDTSTTFISVSDFVCSAQQKEKNRTTFIVSDVNKATLNKTWTSTSIVLCSKSRFRGYYVTPKVYCALLFICLWCTCSFLSHDGADML